MAMNHGATLTPGAANVLVDLVGEDTVKIDSELKKIALAHRGTEPINENEVLGLVARTSEVKPWEFVAPSPPATPASGPAVARSHAVRVPARASAPCATAFAS